MINNASFLLLKKVLTIDENVGMLVSFCFAKTLGIEKTEKIMRKSSKRTLTLKSNKGGENLNCNCNLERKFNSCLGSFIFQGFLEGCRVVYNRVRPQERLRSRQIVAVFADVTRKTWWRKKRNGQSLKNTKIFFTHYVKNLSFYGLPKRKWERTLVIKNHCIIHIFHKTNGDEALT